MRINKRTLRRMIRQVILEQSDNTMKKRLKTSYGKELTLMEECKFLLGVLSNIAMLLDDVDSTIEIVSRVIADEENLEQSPMPDPARLLDLKRDLAFFKGMIEGGDPNFTKVQDALIQAINTGDMSVLGSLGGDVASFKSTVYEVIDAMHYLFELGTTTGYELTIEEYIELGEKFAKEGYSPNPY